MYMHISNVATSSMSLVFYFNSVFKSSLWLWKKKVRNFETRACNQVRSWMCVEIRRPLTGPTSGLSWHRKASTQWSHKHIALMQLNINHGYIDRKKRVTYQSKKNSHVYMGKVRFFFAFFHMHKIDKHKNGDDIKNTVMPINVPNGLIFVSLLVLNFVYSQVAYYNPTKVIINDLNLSCLSGKWDVIYALIYGYINLGTTVFSSGIFHVQNLTSKALLNVSLVYKESAWRSLRKSKCLTASLICVCSDQQ